MFWMNWKLPKDLLVYIEFEKVQSIAFVSYKCPVQTALLLFWCLISLENMLVENFWKFKSN